MNSGVTTTRPRYGHLMVMFGLFLSLLTLTFQATSPGRSMAFGVSEVAQLSNNYRIEAGLPSLILSETLTKSAQAKADDMATKGYFAHNSPDGTAPWDFFANVGYSYSTAGENLALSNQSASSVADGWYNSPGHRANMLNTHFTEVGYGIAFVPSFTYNDTVYSDVYLVAAHYAEPTPVGSATQFTVKPQSTTPLSPTTTETQGTSTPQTATQGTTPTAQPQLQPQATTGETITSGPGVTTITNKNPSLISKIAYAGLGVGVVLVFLGTIIEIRRLLRHQPILPHLPHAPHHR